MTLLSNKIGKRFGRLTVLEYAGKNKSGRSQWKCKCDCGEIVIRPNSALRQQNWELSCGCVRNEKSTKRLTVHGMCGVPGYYTWTHLKGRCQDPTDPAFKNYGGRGIKICERWKKFKNFIEDMGIKPEGHQLDRIDNDGDYEPGNCRWVLPAVNSLNRRVTIYLTYGGVSLTMKEWSELLGIKYHSLYSRKYRGASDEEALSMAGKGKLEEVLSRYT